MILRGLMVSIKLGTRHWPGLAATHGRPPADPVERDNERLRARTSQLEADLDTARRVIEVQGKVSAYAGDRCQEAASSRLLRIFA